MSRLPVLLLLWPVLGCSSEPSAFAGVPCTSVKRGLRELQFASAASRRKLENCAGDSPCNILNPGLAVSDMELHLAV